MAFKTSSHTQDHEEEPEDYDSMVESLALLAKKFGSGFRSIDTRRFVKSQGTSRSGSKDKSLSKEDGRKEGPKCYDCGGYGQKQGDCANLKPPSNHRADEEIEERENDFGMGHLASTMHIEKSDDMETDPFTVASEKDENEDDTTTDGLTRDYYIRHDKRIEVVEINKKLALQVKELEAKKMTQHKQPRMLEERLNSCVTENENLKKEVSQFKKMIKMMNETIQHDEIPSQSKSGVDRS